MKKKEAEEVVMIRKTISIGNQGFDSIREKDYFCVDKTGFVKEWWESQDMVTLITRPCRFGKTWNISILNCFFSLEYAGRSDLFESYAIIAIPENNEKNSALPFLHYFRDLL